MSTTCDCILTHFSEEFVGKNLFFDFYRNNASSLTLNLKSLFSNDITLISVQNKMDRKSNSIVFDPDLFTITYTFNNDSELWQVPLMTDSFQYTVKNNYTQQLAVCTITIRELKENVITFKDNPIIQLTSPYAKQIEINLNHFILSESFVCYQISQNYDTSYIQKLTIDSNNNRQINIDFQPLGSFNGSVMITTIYYYVALGDQIPVIESERDFALGKIDIEFM